MIQIPTFLKTRERMRAFAERLDADTLLSIEPGFNNNVAWHLGHIVVTHQVLCYKLAGVPMNVDDDQVAAFIKGSSPKDWTSPPDVGAMVPLITELAERFASDFERGLFKEFKPYTTSVGLELDSLEAAFTYNLMHEGIHFGFAQAQARR